jgi:hypothetical protein
MAKNWCPLPITVADRDHPLSIKESAGGLGAVEYRAWARITEFVAYHERPVPTADSIGASCLSIPKAEFKRAVRRLLEKGLIFEHEVDGDVGYATPAAAAELAVNRDEKLKGLTPNARQKARENLVKSFEDLAKKPTKSLQKVGTFSTERASAIAENCSKFNGPTSQTYTKIEMEREREREREIEKNAGRSVSTILPPTSLPSEQDAARASEPIKIFHGMNPDLRDWVERFLAAYPANPTGEPWPETEILWVQACQSFGAERREEILKTWTSIYRRQWVNVPETADLVDGAKDHLWDMRQKIRADYPLLDVGDPMPPTSWLRAIAKGDIRADEWQRAFAKPEKARWLTWAALTRAQHGDLPFKPVDEYDRKMRAECKGLY